MENTDAWWTLFEKTGCVEAYLAYHWAAEEGQGGDASSPPGPLLSN